MSLHHDRLIALIDRRVQEWIDTLPAGGMYAPMAYIMRLPAKRVRPLATLICCELFGGKAADALDAAVGLELFHNFTLMHDDIMDQAPLRRGSQTVHLKWDVNTAILSGDAMLVKAYELLCGTPAILPVFNLHALAVCEGQQQDMDFESRGQVSVEEYLSMVRNKTAMLLGCAMRIGGAIGGGSPEAVEKLGAMGEDLGIAFQLKDDMLDTFGDPGLVGKQQGGDLRAGKRTWLLIRGLELSDADGRTELREELARRPEQRNVPRMTRVLAGLGLEQAITATIQGYEQAALKALEELEVPEENKTTLLGLAQMLMDRRN